ncbi:MAG: hypothetical protein KJO12_10415 [Ignavibacteria bacterium]|nr:hypothetical protein [Ignavibacteria bacterium]
MIFCVGISQAQYFESVEKEAERILISLSDGDSLSSFELSNLKELLASHNELNFSETNLNITQQSIDSLKNHLNEIETELKIIPTDSVFVLFNDWYLHFQNIFYDYSKQEFFSSPKQKILFFSTSMSCYCTLKMSRIQTAELLKYLSANANKYEYWIIDSYWYNDLQIKYETLFAPSVIVFDGSNQVLYKIEYEEKMLVSLEKFLNTKNQ